MLAEGGFLGLETMGERLTAMTTWLLTKCTLCSIPCMALMRQIPYIGVTEEVLRSETVSRHEAGMSAILGSHQEVHFLCLAWMIVEGRPGIRVSRTGFATGG